MSDFFIEIFSVTNGRRLSSSRVGGDSSTENGAASRASRQRRKVACILLSAFCFFGGSTAPAASTPSSAEIARAGRRIWQNECGGTVAGLTSWNAGEDFASLGIGHFIWYPAGRAGPFEESFPRFVAYARQRGWKLPELLLPPHVACPWQTRAEFSAAADSRVMTQLRRFLVDTIDLQAGFLALRLEEALPKMLAAAAPSERAAIERRFRRVAQSPNGWYALIDYVNFKGEGLLATERYHGRGWGLLQVLERMSDEGEATRSFAAAAAEVLRERVQKAPSERHETRWLPGWLNRVATYRASSSR